MNNKTPYRYDPFASGLAEETRESVPASLLESQPGADGAALPAVEVEAPADAEVKMVSENWIEPEQEKVFPESLAQRLIAARDARGWKTADVASKLRLPLHVVQTIEAEQFDRIGHGIYLRGYLNNYARLVGVPTCAVDAVLQKHAAPPPELVASGRVSHSRYLIDRYSGSALYVVLTGVIFVPLVMFAMNMGSDGAARLLPLDGPTATVALPVASPTVDLPLTKQESSSGTAATTTAPATLAATTPAAGDAPLMASLTPVLRPQASDSAQGAPTLKLSLAEASWVEIVDTDGKRLESGILPAGTIKSYGTDKALDVRIGNTTGAKFEVNGSEQDITPYNRGNVAHFRLSAAGKLQSRVDAQ
jgi:cytoskeleton protein RodZ